MATHLGVYRFDEHSSTFAPDPRFRVFPDRPRFVFALEEDAERRLWMHSIDETTGAQETGVAIPNGDGSWRWDPEPFRLTGGTTVEAIFADRDGVVWAGTHDGLIRLDPRAKGREPRRFAALLRSVTTRLGRLRLDMAPNAAGGGGPPHPLRRPRPPFRVRGPDLRRVATGPVSGPARRER